MAINSDPIENLKKASQVAREKKEKSFFVFDMDSTLFCMKYRTQALIESCLRDSLFCKKFVNQTHKIKQIEVTETDWSVPEIMSRHGFCPQSDIVLAVNKIWRKGFFSNDYLYLDQPYKGCVQFIQNVYQTGAKVYYLTARNHFTMREGTIQSLKYWKFPLEKDNKNLIMKKDQDVTDADYKTIYLKQLEKQCEALLFFENEPVILNQVAKILPQVLIFWMNSTHCRKEEPPKKALSLSTSYIF